MWPRHWREAGTCGGRAWQPLQEQPVLGGGVSLARETGAGELFWPSMAPRQVCAELPVAGGGALG